MATAKERLEAAEQLLKDRLEARKAGDEAEILEAEAAKAELELSNLDALEKAEKDLGKIGKDWLPVYTEFGVIIIKRCHAMVYNKFQDEEKYTSNAKKALLSSCVFHPLLDKIESWYEIQPHIVNLCCDAIAYLAGVRKAAVAGK